MLGNATFRPRSAHGWLAPRLIASTPAPVLCSFSLPASTNPTAGPRSPAAAPAASPPASSTVQRLLAARRDEEALLTKELLDAEAHAGEAEAEVAAADAAASTAIRGEMEEAMLVTAPAGRGGGSEAAGRLSGKAARARSQACSSGGTSRSNRSVRSSARWRDGAQIAEQAGVRGGRVRARRCHAKRGNRPGRRPVSGQGAGR